METGALAEQIRQVDIRPKQYTPGSDRSYVFNPVLYRDMVKKEALDYADDLKVAFGVGITLALEAAAMAYFGPKLAELGVPGNAQDVLVGVTALFSILVPVSIKYQLPSLEQRLAKTEHARATASLQPVSNGIDEIS